MARHPPHPRWPGAARIAVQFVLNYEEGAERSVLHGDEASESFLSEMVAAQPIAGMRHMSMESLYEYGSRAGFWRLKRLFDDNAAPLTVFGVAQALERNPEAVAGMLASNWEIASHGYRWIDNQHLSGGGRARAHRRGHRDPHPRHGGRAPSAGIKAAPAPTPRGSWRRKAAFFTTPTATPTTCRTSTPGHGRPQLIVPYTLDTNDMRFVAPQGFKQRRPVLRLSARRLQRSLCGRRDGAEDAVDRSALPDRRATRAARVAPPLSRACPGARPGLDRAPGRHRAPLAGPVRDRERRPDGRRR